MRGWAPWGVQSAARLTSVLGSSFSSCPRGELLILLSTNELRVLYTFLLAPATFLRAKSNCHGDESTRDFGLLGIPSCD